MLIYVGTYTRNGSEGVYLLRQDPATGALTNLGCVGRAENPAFLALHSGKRFLYAVNELGEFQGKPGGGVTAFAVDAASGALRLLNQQPTGGAHPCHLSVDATGRCLLAGNYTGGSVAVVPLAADGSLQTPSQLIQHRGSGADKARQEAAHAHSVTLDRANRYAYVADLGLDRVMIYALDAAKGKLTPASTPYAATHAAAGPRHFAFHPSAKFAYVVNELDCTVTAFACEPATGALTEIQHLSGLPYGQPRPGDTGADIHVHPSGRFVYSSNRGHDSIAIFAVDANSGRLSLLGCESTGGHTPRNFGVDPSGTFLLAANQDSGTIVVLRIDARSGRLTPTGHTVQVPFPVCVLFAA